jgi:BCCT, betaine/carnitine/choline family transporter
LPHAVFALIAMFLRDRTAWAPFVGVFIAMISRGRKLWEVYVYSLFIPVGYCLVFYSVFGGVGLRQSRQALELGLLGATYFNDSGHFLVAGSDICYDVPQQDVLVDDALVFTNHLKGVTPVCRFDEDNTAFGAYNVFHSFKFPESIGGSALGVTISILFILASVIQSIRSCDTASLVVDNLASSGRRNVHWARRAFWAITIGALASALLSTGGSEALQTIQAVSVLCGFPFTVVLCFMTQSITLMCRAAENPERGNQYTFPDQPEFDMPVYGGMFNAFEFLASLGRPNKARVDIGIDRPTGFQAKEFCKGIFAPFVSLSQVLAVVYPANKVTNAAFVACYASCYLGWVVLISISQIYSEFAGLGWMLFLVAGGLLTMIRSSFRTQFNIRSNSFTDATASCLIWPQVLTQMRVQCDVVVSTRRQEKQSSEDSK